jgi:uncharacterized protein involved in response to NO
MTAVPRYRAHAGPAILSAGFRPFFLLAATWAAIAIPLWLAMYAYGAVLPSALPPLVWHAHEMVFGFAAATVSGFLLTAIPNWTGRMPLQGRPLAVLVLLWAAGRIGVLISAVIGAPAATVADLAFPTVFLGVIAREVVAGRNWRNLPMLTALSLLLIGNLLVHLDTMGITDTAGLGNRLGIATLLMLIALVGGRIIPSFTRNWLTKTRRETTLPAPAGRLDTAMLVVTALALAAWTMAPDAAAGAWMMLLAGLVAAMRLSRWRGMHTRQEPLLLILHIGYGWLAAGLLLLGLDGIFEFMPPAGALHALTVGAIGTMTLAVMTRASLGHMGRLLVAGPATKAIYVLVTSAAILRIVSPFAGNSMVIVLSMAGAAWTGAFALFVFFYGGPLASPSVKGRAARPI